MIERLKHSWRGYHPVIRWVLIGALAITFVYGILGTLGHLPEPGYARWFG